MQRIHIPEAILRTFDASNEKQRYIVKDANHYWFACPDLPDYNKNLQMWISPKDPLLFLGEEKIDTPSCDCICDARPLPKAAGLI